MKQIILVIGILVAVAFPISADQTGAGLRTAVLHEIKAAFGPVAGKPGSERLLPATCPVRLPVLSGEDGVTA